MSGRSLIDMLHNRPLTAAEERAVDERVDQVREAVRSGRPEAPLAPPVDSYVVEKCEEDQQQGWDKRPDEWRRVMEHHGFRWYEARQLDAHPRVGPQVYVPTKISDFTEGHAVDPDLAARIEAGEIDPTGAVWNLGSQYRLRAQPCGQWRNDLHQQLPEPMQMAFTLKDLITGFGAPPGGPEAFDTWFADHSMRFRAAAAGLVLPK